jgi:hypothetical protein
LAVAWQIKQEDLKHYPHFDKHLPLDEIEKIIMDRERVRTNAFFPFLRYIEKWRPYRPNGKSKKERPIRYAARRDAYIFAYYRSLLSEKYEKELSALGIQNCPIAYRKIPVTPGLTGGKCNIHFAKDAFDAVVQMGNCCAVALDVSSFFESLDHERLRAIWCRMFEMDELRPDHAAVFKAMTKYSVVDREKAYERLGFFGTKMKNGKMSKGFLKPFKEMPTQLCSTKDFRKKIAGGDPSMPSLIETNDLPYGIPQGSPISDLLANIYMIDFDVLLSKWVQARGGVYFRYSDDILMILPGGAKEGLEARDFACEQIKNFGDEIKIKPEKTSIVRFFETAEDKLQFEPIENSGKNGLEYLGFRFDGRYVYLRDSTVSGFYRKITYSVRQAAYAHISRYHGKSLSFLINSFDLDRFVQDFGRVEGFDSNTEYQDWTFWTYAKRAGEIFGLMGSPILRQLRNHRKLVKSRVDEELTRAFISMQPRTMSVEVSPPNWQA